MAEEEASNTSLLFDAIERHGGEAALRAFQAAYSGAQIKVPRNVQNRSRLVTSLGLDVAQKVADDLAVSDADGCPIEFRAYIPVGPRSYVSRMKSRIEALFAAGKSVDEVALQAGCSRRTAFSHKRRLGLPRKRPVLTAEQRAARRLAKRKSGLKNRSHNKSIVALYVAGTPVRSIASKFDLTTNQVYHRLRDWRRRQGVAE